MKERRDKRINVMLGADVRHKDELQTVRLTNVSNGGAGVMGQAPPIGTAVILERNDLKIPGRIAWITPGFFGINFDSPEDAKEIMRRRTGPTVKAELPVHAKAIVRPAAETARPRSVRHATSHRDPLEFGMRVVRRTDPS